MGRVVRLDGLSGNRRWQSGRKIQHRSQRWLSVQKDGGANPASGYSLIKATDLEGAIGKAKVCPILTAGGSVELAEAFDM